MVEDFSIYEWRGTRGIIKFTLFMGFTVKKLLRRLMTFWSSSKNIQGNLSSSTSNISTISILNITNFSSTICWSILIQLFFTTRIQCISLIWHWIVHLSLTNNWLSCIEVIIRLHCFTHLNTFQHRGRIRQMSTVSKIFWVSNLNSVTSTKGGYFNVFWLQMRIISFPDFIHHSKKPVRRRCWQIWVNGFSRRSLENGRHGLTTTNQEST